MSNQFFPAFDGFGRVIPFLVTQRSFQASTLVTRGQGGSEFRASLWAYPRWKWGVSLPVLTDTAQGDALRTVIAFLMDRRGQQDSFLFCPPEDSLLMSDSVRCKGNTLTGVQIGVGDGTQKVFALVRPYGAGSYPYGAHAEPVPWVDTRNMAPVFRVNGVVQPGVTFATTDGATGGVLATFTTAPGAGLAVTADFEMAYRVRLTSDVVDFKAWAWQLNHGAEIELEQVLA